MAIAIRGSAAKPGTSSVTVSQADYSTTPQAGDLLLIWVAGGSSDASYGNTVPDSTPTGWTRRGTLPFFNQTAAPTMVGGGVWYTKTAAGSAADNVTFDFSPLGTPPPDQECVAQAYALSGADTVTVTDGTVPNANTSTNALATTIDAPSVTVAQATSWLFVGALAGYRPSTGGSWTAPSGMTKDQDTLETSGTVSLQAAIFHKALSASGATGVQTATNPAAGARGMLAGSIAILAAVPAVPLPVARSSRRGPFRRLRRSFTTSPTPTTPVAPPTTPPFNTPPRPSRWRPSRRSYSTTPPAPAAAPPVASPPPTNTLSRPRPLRWLTGRRTSTTTPVPTQAAAPVPQTAATPEPLQWGPLEAPERRRAHVTGHTQISGTATATVLIVDDDEALALLL